MIKSLNTHRNRELDLLNCEGEVLMFKHDIVYFKIKNNDGEFYLKCEKGFFQKNFNFDSFPEEGHTEKYAKYVFADYSTLKK